MAFERVRKWLRPKGAKKIAAEAEKMKEMLHRFRNANSLKPRLMKPWGRRVGDAEEHIRHITSQMDHFIKDYGASSASGKHGYQKLELGKKKVVPVGSFHILELQFEHGDGTGSLFGVVKNMDTGYVTGWRVYHPNSNWVMHARNFDFLE